MSTKRYRATHLKAIMDEQGRKRSWLARKVGVSESFIRFILSGERTVSEEVAERIATALGVPLFFAFDGTDVPDNGAIVPVARVA
jgi:transcriptional regulator with XRE-family HTH domain